MSLASKLKPTPIKLGLAFLLLFFLVPVVQLSHPQCGDYAGLPHGDGAPAVRCLDGNRTLFSYVLLKGHFTRELNSYGGWDWKLYEQPLYLNIIAGAALSYLVAALAMGYFRPKQLSAKGESDPIS
jgi:hypothetical protein